MADDLRNSGLQKSKSRTNLILGSMKGSFKMAESLLVPGSNKKVLNLEVPGVRLMDKDQYKKQEVCQVCFFGFGKLTRQHHCRICANSVCSSCSASSLNKERCCDVCAHKYSDSQRQTIKANILFELEGAAILIVQSRNSQQQELKKINQQSINLENSDKTIEASQKRLIQLQKQLQSLKQSRALLEREISQIQG